MLKSILKISGFLACSTLVLVGSSAVAEEKPAVSAPNGDNKPLAASIPETTPSVTPTVATSNKDAMTALQALNNRYQCSPNRLDANSSREQFGAVLDSCITAMETKLANEPSSIPSSDLQELKQLAQSFKSDVIALNDRLDKVEKVALAQSEVSQFSTTTKLVGEAIIAFSDVFGSGRAGGGPLNANAIVSNRVRLNLRTSFNGKDLLITRLQARNSNSFSSPAVANTNQVRLGFEGTEENAEFLHLLQYQMPFGGEVATGIPTTKITASAVGNELDTYLKKNFNPVLAPAGTGSISRYGRFNPIYRLSGEGAGVMVDHSFNQQFGVALGYAVPRGTQPGTNPPLPRDIAADPTTNNGLFGGSNLFFSQLTYSPNPNLDLGLIYARSYHSGGTGVSGLNGTAFANSPFGTVPTSANHYSILASTKLNPSTTLSGWAGLTSANREDATGSADIWNYAATLAFDNVGGAGSTLGFVVGLPPKATTNSGLTAARVNPDTPFHLETFYKYKLNNNLYITPGVVMILNPEGNAANPTLFLGTIRTTFNF